MVTRCLILAANLILIFYIQKSDLQQIQFHFSFTAKSAAEYVYLDFIRASAQKAISLFA